MPSKLSAQLIRIFCWGFFYVYSFIVYQSAVLPPSRIPSFLSLVNDKIIHGASYFILFGAAFLAFKNSKWVYLRTLPDKSALVYCALMGIITEISQIFVKGRACEAADWSADVLGAVLGMILFRLIAARGNEA